jgi:hypothetical protein
MPDPDLNLLLHGSTEALPEQVPLRAGPLALIFEAGDLRYISLGPRELVRRIYGTVRDGQWGTVPGRLSDLVLSRTEDAFTLTYQSEHRDGAIHFVWRASIVGRPDGTIGFTFAGEARSTFAKNRIGLCVLHPMRHCAGAPATGRRTTGGQRDLRFPELVAVEQPIEGFTDLAALTLEASGTRQLELAFEGDVFETEDQRNWIDASFKTYSTPLSLARPVIVPQGTLIEQRVTLRLLGAERTAIASSAHVRPVRVVGHQEPQEVKVPGIGVGLGAPDVDVPPRTLALLKELNPAHLRVDLPLASAGWEERLDSALQLRRVLDCGLELALLVGPECGAALESLARLLPARAAVARILAFAADRPTTSVEALGLVRERLLSRTPGLDAAGVGSRGDLYELHLYPPPAAEIICWSMNPQAHASDITSLAETPPAAGEQVRSVRARHPGAFTAVTPVTLGPRSRPSAAPPREPHPLYGSLFGAAWTLAVAAHLAQAGAGSATFLASLQELAVAGTNVHPLFHVLCDLCDCAGGTVALAGESTGDVASLLVRRRSGAVLLLANLSRHPRTAPVPPGFAPASLRVLDQATALRAGAEWAVFRAERHSAAGVSSVHLGAFATGRLDGEITGSQ